MFDIAHIPWSLNNMAPWWEVSATVLGKICLERWSWWGALAAAIPDGPGQPGINHFEGRSLFHSALHLYFFPFSLCILSFTNVFFRIHFCFFTRSRVFLPIWVHFNSVLENIVSSSSHSCHLLALRSKPYQARSWLAWKMAQTAKELWEWRL